MEISEGYASNFLFPQNLALQATEEALHAREEQEASVEREGGKRTHICK